MDLGYALSSEEHYEGEVLPEVQEPEPSPRQPVRA
jgi:hypothetical protein